MKYIRKENKTIEAVQWTGANGDEIRAFAGIKHVEIDPVGGFVAVNATAADGVSSWEITGRVGDYITNTGGDIWLWDRQLFEATFEPE